MNGRSIATMGILTARLSSPAFDPDAAAWFTLAEAADGAAIPAANKAAVSALVAGLKADPSPNAGVSQWQAIAFLHVLSAAGFEGMKIPLKGTAGTFNAFVAGDYSRTLGLKGDASSKYINSNRAGNADGQDNFSMFAHLGERFGGSYQGFFGGSSSGGPGYAVMFSDPVYSRAKNSTPTYPPGAHNLGLYGISRNSPANYQWTAGAGEDGAGTEASDGNGSETVKFYSLSDASYKTANRLSIIGCGAAVDLPALKARTATYMAALV